MEFTKTEYPTFPSSLLTVQSGVAQASNAGETLPSQSPLGNKLRHELNFLTHVLGSCRETGQVQGEKGGHYLGPTQRISEDQKHEKAGQALEVKTEILTVRQQGSC